MARDGTQGESSPTARALRLLAKLFQGQPGDIELPPESGLRDPRLPPEGLLDALKRARAVSKRLLKTETRPR